MKSEMHISFILTMLASNVTRDHILHDNKFMDVIDEFNRLYRTKKTAVTDEEVMEEMVKSKTYKFHRATSSWWVETVLSTERYEYREENLEQDIFYFIIDTHTKKHVEAIPCNVGPANVDGLREHLDMDCEIYQYMLGRVKRYNHEFEDYNNEIIKFILTGSTSTI